MLLVLNVLAWRFKALAKPGLLTGLFLIGYGASRFVIEYVREPDAHIGFIFDIVTMGQILSLPMMLAGEGMHGLLDQLHADSRPGGRGRSRGASPPPRTAPASGGSTVPARDACHG